MKCFEEGEDSPTVQTIFGLVLFAAFAPQTLRVMRFIKQILAFAVIKILALTILSMRR